MQPKIDILELRRISRLGLPDNAVRVRVWPLLLGISPTDLHSDREILKAFTVVHNRAKDLANAFEEQRRQYSVTKRDYYARKEAAQEAAKERERKLLEESISESETSETSQADVNEVVPFTEQPPEAPIAPNFPTTYWDQVTKDVDRSLWKQVPEEVERLVARDKLHRMICAVICTTEDAEQKPLHYFQGYHDIASVFLLTCGEELGFSLLRRLSTSYLRDQMQERLDYMMGLLKLLFPLVKSIDGNIARFLAKSQVQPYAALPWVMTWYSHVLENQLLSERLFDLFLASPSWMPLYLAAALVVYMSAHGLYSCPCEFSEVHTFVSKFCSRTDLPWESLIKDSLQYYELFPPSHLDLNASLPSDSYLLRYPYYWAPKEEKLADVGLSRNWKLSIAGAGVLALSAAAIGISMYMKGGFDNVPL
jgi:hypothetical protein